MRAPLYFFVAGLPIPQPRGRARNMGKFARVFNAPGKHDDWKMIVRNEARLAWVASDPEIIPIPWAGPLCVNLTFYFPRPKSHFNTKGFLKDKAPKWHTTKPDRDNSDKAVLDALTNLGIWGDDKQVCDGRIRKFYTEYTTPDLQGQMGCRIEIKEADTEQGNPRTTPGELIL